MQSQTLTYCLNCKRKTMPTRGSFHVVWFIVLLLLGLIPGLIYVAYYYMKDLECPHCKKKNWGEPSNDEPSNNKLLDNELLEDKPLEDKSSSRFCQKCGFELGMNANYCYNCGTKYGSDDDLNLP